MMLKVLLCIALQSSLSFVVVRNPYHPLRGSSASGIPVRPFSSVPLLATTVGKTENTLSDEELSRRLLNGNAFSAAITTAELKQSYRQLAREFHPDNAETGNAEIFRRISDLHNDMQAQLEHEKLLNATAASHVGPFSWGTGFGTRDAEYGFR